MKAINLTSVTYFARGPLCSYFNEPQKNEIYFLNEPRRSKVGSSKVCRAGECKYSFLNIADGFY